MTSRTILNLIAGEERESSSQNFFEHVSPISGNFSIVKVAHSQLLDVVAAVQSINRAQTVQAKLSAPERRLKFSSMIDFFIEEIETAKNEISIELAWDIGMPVKTAFLKSLPAALEILRATKRVYDDEITEGADNAPMAGSSAVFLGAGDPLVSFCRRVPVILCSGNGVCVKPSSRAPRTVDFMSKLFLKALRRAEVDVGLFSVLHGHGAGAPLKETVGDALLRHPGFKTIFWIGKTASALSAQALAIESEKRFHFVGSGRNPALLFQGFSNEELDLHIGRLALASMDAHGLGPYRPSRFFIQESIYKDVVERMSEKLVKLKVGDPLNGETDIGPMLKTEADHFERQIGLALSETGRQVTGGGRVGSTLSPTLIRDLTNCSTLQGEELSGPWATIASFKYSHEALKYANTSPLGLAGYVLHPETEKAKSTAHKLEVSRIFLSSEPSWPHAVTESVPAVKQSANGDDGIKAVFRFGQWRSRYF